MQTCAAIVLGFRKPRTTYECIYTTTFTSKLSGGLDEPNPKLLGQDKQRLEQQLAVGWISRELRFCTIYTGCSLLLISFSAIPRLQTAKITCKNLFLLVTPKSNLKFYGDRSFQGSVPRLWNELPNSIRSVQSLNVFMSKKKKRKKTLLCKKAFYQFYFIFLAIVLRNVLILILFLSSSENIFGLIWLLLIVKSHEL